jgi:hypothetical protein
MTRTTPPPKDPEALILGALCKWAGRRHPDMPLRSLQEAAAMCAAALPPQRPEDRPAWVESAKKSGPAPVDKSPQALLPVLLGMADGLPDGKIALRVGLTRDQVERRVGWLRSAYGVRSRGDVVAAARAAGDLPEVVAGGGNGAACPPVASNPPMQARGALDAQRPAEGPSGAFPGTADTQAVQEYPENQSPQPPGGLAGQGSPSGPTRSAAAHTGPYSASGPQAASQAVRS